MFFIIDFIILILGFIGTVYSFVKEGFKKGILILILNVGFALVLLFDYGTLWYNIGIIITIVLLLILYIDWYKKDETVESSRRG
jgi:hypothetical protein